MILPKQHLKLSGFDRIQEVLMRVKLSKLELPVDEVYIKVYNEIEAGKCNSLWYGGYMAEIRVSDNKYSIMADGDVIVTLTNKETEETIAYVKDKSNSGTFSSEMSQYIKDDAHLSKIMSGEDPKYELLVSDSNWYEILIEKSNGKVSDDSFASDSDNIFDAICDAVEMMVERILDKEE